MILDNIVGGLSLLSDLLGGFAGVSKGGREIILNCEGEKLTLPVTPSSYEVKTGQNNKVVNIVEFGEALIFGNRKLKTLSLSSFFPHPKHDYPFVVGDILEPTEIVAMIEKWKESKKPVRVIITDSDVNLMMAIMEFSYNEKDGTRDIYYQISFTEYKDLNTPTANNNKQVNETTGLKERSLTKNQQKALDFKTRLDDSLDKIKRAQGTYNAVRMGNYKKVSKLINKGRR